MRVDHHAAVHALASLSVFASSYLATVALAAWLLRAGGLPGLGQWAWLAGGLVATVLTIAMCEHRQWRLGLRAPLRVAGRELLLGAALALMLVLAADRLVLATTALHHARGSGFPWSELIAVYLPAVIHEELVFRGYPFQKLLTLSRPLAIAATSIVFAAMHGANDGLTPIALANLLLAGVLLALAYERYERLWFPIGIHLGWNLLCGPVLGYDVSGFVPAGSVFTTSGAGAPFLTGGVFGIEGSVWIVLVEVAGIAVLLLNARRTRPAAQEPA
jgi:membrane protease YdiL (CAAX protease family)